MFNTKKGCAPCEAKARCAPCTPCAPVSCKVSCPPACCVQADLCVEKNLLSVSKVPGITGGTYDSLVLTYEIVLNNRGGCVLSTMQIHDTFAGLTVSGTMTLALAVSTSDSNLVLDTVSNILASGDLLVASKSTLPAGSTSRVLITLTITTATGTVVVDQLLNTITVTGFVQYSSGGCGCCKREQAMEPISVKSTLWEDPDGVLIVST